jgi:hypothetical protein
VKTGPLRQNRAESATLLKICRRWIDEISNGSTDGESARLDGIEVFAVPRVWRCSDATAN